MNIGEKGAAMYGAHASVTWAALASVINAAQREAEEEQDAPAAPAEAASSPSSSSSSASTSTPQGDGDAGQPGATV